MKAKGLLSRFAAFLYHYHYYEAAEEEKNQNANDGKNVSSVLSCNSNSALVNVFLQKEAMQKPSQAEKMLSHTP